MVTTQHTHFTLNQDTFLNQDTYQTYRTNLLWGKAFQWRRPSRRYWSWSSHNWSRSSHNWSRSSHNWSRSSHNWSSSMSSSCNSCSSSYNSYSSMRSSHKMSSHSMSSSSKNSTSNMSHHRSVVFWQISTPILLQRQALRKNRCRNRSRSLLQLPKRSYLQQDRQDSKLRQWQP